MNKEIKICFASSSGGHYEELMCLNPLMKKYNSFCLTEYNGSSSHNEIIPTYYCQQINRKEKLFFIKLIFLFNKELFVYIKERPTFIISTGALVTIPICLIGKLFQTKIIYIESFARINDASLTGKVMKHFADLFFIQWPEMKEIYPNSIYVGGLF